MPSMMDAGLDFGFFPGIANLLIGIFDRTSCKCRSGDRRSQERLLPLAASLSVGIEHRKTIHAA